MTRATRSGSGFALAIGVSIFAASLIATRPLYAAALAFAVAGAAVVSYAREVPATRALVIGVLALCASVDIIGRLRIGPNSAYAWSTGAVCILSVLVAVFLPIHAVPRPGRRALGLMALFPSFALVSIVWAVPTQAGVQNILVYLILPALATVSAVATATGVIQVNAMRRALFWTFATATILFAASLLLDWLGGDAFMGTRSYAGFAAVGVAWTAAFARYRYRPELGLALIMLGLILLSLSRTAFAVALLLFAFALFGLRTPRDLGRSVAVLGAIAVLSLGAYAYANPFSDRLTKGDIVTLPTGVGINLTGRADIWRVTWDSALASPAVGQGAGSAEVAVLLVSNAADHPHNDYLRIFHDFGVLGLAFFVLAFSAPVVTAARSLLATSRDRSATRGLHLAAILTPLALLLEMITDNSLVYLFVVAPVATIAGASLGLARHGRAKFANTHGERRG